MLMRVVMIETNRKVELGGELSSSLNAMQCNCKARCFDSISSLIGDIVAMWCVVWCCKDR